MALAVIAGPVVVGTADAAHAGMQINHNEVAGRDDPRRAQQRRRTSALAAVGAAAVAASVPMTLDGLVMARIAVNHNETPARDGLVTRDRRRP